MAPERETEKPMSDPITPGVLPAALKDLHRPTPTEEIKHREQRKKDGSSFTLDYVDARYVQTMLDETVGPENWQSAFNDSAIGGVRCGIGILVAREDGGSAWVWKWDVGDPTEIEPVKGAHSDAFKRAGVQWGIARDLYDDRIDASPSAERRPIRERAEDPGDSRPARRESPPPEPRAPKVRLNPDDAPWACPDHGEVEIVPAGTSRRTGRPYKAFYACPERDCDQKGPSVTASSGSGYRDDRD